MIRHVFGLVWHRKRAYALIVAEILVTFLILFGLVAATLHFSRLYRLPLGFGVDNVWGVSISTGAREWQEGDDATLRQLLSVLNQQPEIDTAGTLEDPPFETGGSSSNMDLQGASVEVNLNATSDGLPAALGMTLLEGRWYGPEDDGQTVTPVVINTLLRDAIGESAVPGALLSPEERYRIVGIFVDFRQHGEFSTPRPTMILRQDAHYRSSPSLVLIVRPGVTLGFEERLLGVMQQAAPGWDFEVIPWTTSQASHFRAYVTPLLIAAVLVLFLVVMVGLGLLGVLWQNIIRRTPEMGLRRAMGAPARAVRLQVILELLAVASLALVLGLIIVVQLPLAGIISAMTWSLFVPAAMIAAVALLGMCVLFALYPSYQATRQDPVEALRYE